MKEQKIKLIVFDAYGVILKGGYPRTMRILAKMFHKNWQDLYAIFYTKYFNLAAEGKISEKDSWQKPISYFKIPLSWKKVLSIHINGMKINKENFKLANNLSSRYITVLLTKNTPLQFKMGIVKKFNLTPLFTHIINTYNLKLPKAGKETYQYLMKRFKVKPKEIFYVDDQESNLIEARKMGIHAHLYKNLPLFKKVLKKFKIL